MNRFQMLSLSLVAILAGPAHAQVCSGGNDGGMDATGNQCNTFNGLAAFTAGPAITPPAQVTKALTAHASHKQPAIRLAQMSGKKSTPTAIDASASRRVRAAVPPSVSAKTGRIAITSEAFCSGGASGGMDVNGDECGGASALTENSVVAQRNSGGVP